jgi:hypothetical protein
MTDDEQPVINTEEQSDADEVSVNRIDEQIRTLAESAAEDREAFESPATPPDEQRATELLREGFGPAVWVYVEGHTGGRNRQFGRAELALLERAMNDWLELYARCYGVELDARFSVREAAKLLVETRNVRETAQLLTRVPDR